jgi:hypothetical protein
VRRDGGKPHCLSVAVTEAILRLFALSFPAVRAWVRRYEFTRRPLTFLRLALPQVMELPGETVLDDEMADTEADEGDNKAGEADEEPECDEDSQASCLMLEDEDSPADQREGVRSPPSPGKAPAPKKPRTLSSFWNSGPAVVASPSLRPPSLDQLRVLLPNGTAVCSEQSTPIAGLILQEAEGWRRARLIEEISGEVDDWASKAERRRRKLTRRYRRMRRRVDRRSKELEWWQRCMSDLFFEFGVEADITPHTSDDSD